MTCYAVQCTSLHLRGCHEDKYSYDIANECAACKGHLGANDADSFGCVKTID